MGTIRKTLDDYELTRVNNDTNGNPRYVIHYLAFSPALTSVGVLDRYAEAVKIANKIGGRKYSAKRYGGGIVFQCYNTSRLLDRIAEILEEETK